MNIRQQLFVSLITAILFFSITDISQAANNKNNLFDFLTIINKHGWHGRLYELKYPFEPEIRVFSARLYYELPEDDGYRESVSLFQLTFQNSEDIPHYNKKREHVYPDSYQEGRFPVDKYKHLLNVPTHVKTKWNSYRYEKSVYVVYAGPTRQDITTMHKLLKRFIPLNEQSNKAALQQFEETLKKRYKNQKELYEAVMIIQNALISKGYYQSNSVDGIFGTITKKALQKFLKKNGYYNGEIDGSWGRGSIDSLRKYQKGINIKVTGRLDLETAKLIKKSIVHEN